MPDISMCADDKCPARSRCYRHKASGTVPNKHQQAFTDFQRHPKDRRCGHFWPTYVLAGGVIVRNTKDEAND